MTKTKRITFLISTLGGGGAEGVCVTLANGFAEQDWQVDLVILNLNNAVYHDHLSDKVNLVVLDVNHARYAAPVLLKYIRKEQPEKILVFNYELAVLLVLLRPIFRFKTKIIARNINTLSQKQKLVSGFWRKHIVQRMVDTLYCKVDHVINQCKAMEQDLLSIFSNFQGKTSVIYNPVASHVEAYAKTVDFEKVEKQDYLLCVGRLEEQKAFHYGIEAFAKVASAFPNLRLKIVGQGSLEQDLKQLSIDLNIAERVDFEGFQKDMIPYYLHAKATVLTSLYEGFPNVLVESITLGTPVIAFDCPSGPSEIVVEGENGYLVEYLSVEGLTEKMLSLFSSEFEAHSIHLTAVKYSAVEVIKRYETLVQGSVRTAYSESQKFF